MELNIKDFDELEQYFKRKQQHTDELEQENIELTRENMKLKREIEKLQKSQTEYINQILRKPSTAAEDELVSIYTSSIPEIFKGRER